MEEYIFMKKMSQIRRDKENQNDNTTQNFARIINPDSWFYIIFALYSYSFMLLLAVGHTKL